MEEVYYNPRHPLGYTGNRKELTRLMPKAGKWLQTQPTYTLHKPVRRKFKTRKYRTSGIDRQWQSDLVDMQKLKRKNSGNGYILTAIDIFSRYAWAVPIKTKAYPHVIDGFKKIFVDRKPNLLQTDQGTEFENKNIQAFFKQHNIKQFSVKSPYKAAIIERFHRTLRSRMYRYFTRHGTQRWVDVLPDLLHSYNNAQHSSLYDQSPASINKENAMDLWELRNSPCKRRSKPQFRVGDYVRLALVHKTFDHGYTPNWTEELFTISAVDAKYEPIMYRVQDSSGEEIEGKFYKNELQKVDNVYRIEKILKVQTRKDGKMYYRVKWLGYKEPSWIEANQLI